MAENKKYIIEKYQKEDLQLYIFFLLASLIIISTGILLFFFSNKLIYGTFAKVLLVGGPILFLKYLLQSILIFKSNKSNQKTEDMVKLLSIEQVQITEKQTANKKHKKITVSLMLIISFACLMSCFYLEAKLVIAMTIGLLFLLSLEYVFQTIHDYRLFEYQYRLEREES